jgi:hypothetical protein
MKLPKHHYVPVFYLNQWRRPDNRLIEFSRPYRDKVKPRMTSPEGTGYVRGLYRMPGVADEFAEVIEESFFKRLDDKAAYAHQKMLNKDFGGMTLAMREAWTLFILSIIMRSPKMVSDFLQEIIKDLPEQWPEIQKRWAEEHPGEEVLADFNPTTAKQYSLVSLRRFIANDAIGTLIINMVWGTFELAKSGERLLTSDRPIVMTDGLGYTDSHLAIPLSPTMLFLAANNQETIDVIRKMPTREMVRNSNKRIVRSAVKYVWAQDHSHDALITTRMSLDAKDVPSIFAGKRGPREGKELISLAKQIAVRRN